MRVLVVDDSSFVRQAVRALVESASGADIDEASDGAEALRRVVANDYDIIITDCAMPNMCGKEFVRSYRAARGKAWVIMLSSEAAKEHVIEAVRAGINDYCVKPLTAEALAAKLKTWANKRAA